VKVLVADDDLDIRDITAFALRREGFSVSVANDGRQALHLWKSSMPDVVLLDLQMPNMNGFDVLRSIRSEAATPVIFLSARNNDDDIVRGFQLGADDYVTKPFSPRQLVARIHSVARRSGRAVASVESEVKAAGMVLHVESHEVSRDGRVVRMTPTEFRLLHTLMVNAGRVVPSNRLIEETWGAHGGDSNMLKTHVYHIRKKLQIADGERGHIQSMIGLGYTMAD
jgi:DNA-binding response OmpR family regulator